MSISLIGVSHCSFSIASNKLKCRLRFCLEPAVLCYVHKSEDFFLDIELVRIASSVLQQGSGTSKGVGYVSFAPCEGAQLAFDKVNEPEALMQDGRKLRVQFAGSKARRALFEVVVPLTIPIVALQRRKASPQSKRD